MSDPKTLGVIVGRFQIHALHDAHVGLIDTALGREDLVLVLIGGHKDVRITPRNPLPWEARRHMILETFPIAAAEGRLVVDHVADIGSDEFWCRLVDDKIFETLREYGINPGDVILYGGRDSFLDMYEGMFETQVYRYEHDADHIEATMHRQAIYAAGPQATADFRKGVIWAAHHRWPVVLGVVDIAVFNPSFEAILLGRKPLEEQWRLFGGFADTASYSYEDDAHREAKEEAGVNLHELHYLGSHTVEDFRYQREIDSIRTSLFVATTEDEGIAGDDIQEILWISVDIVTKDIDELIVPEHRILLTQALTYAHARRTPGMDANQFMMGP